MDKSLILNNIEIIDDCWVWKKSLNSAGYGQTTMDGKYWTTHRYSYTCFVGEIPKGLVIRHKCHNTKCCNPDHLIPGTNRDNYMDSKEVHKNADAKRRSKWIIGNTEYGTCKEVVEKTGISMNAVLKYTVDGVFNIESYRAGCVKANKTPRV